MHIALQVNDIIQIICKHALTSERGSDGLANLACVQQSLGAIALDVLWRDIPAQALLYAFPLDRVKLDVKGRRISLKLLDINDWKRFAHYAPHIRVIRHGFRWTEWSINFQDVLHILHVGLCRKNSPSFLPFLQGIYWSASILEIVKLTIFIVPSLKRFIVRLGDRTPGMCDGFKVTDQCEAMITLISKLLHTSASLQEFDVTPLSPLVEEKISSLLEQSRSLTHVNVVPTRGLICTLATLPDLRFLKMYSVQESHDRRSVNDVGSSADLFPALEGLDITTETLNPIINLLKDVHCFARHSIRIVCESACTAEEVSSFLERAISTEHHETFENFVFCTGFDEDRQLLPHEYLIKLHHIQALLAFRNLKKIGFNNKLPVDLNDDDLQMITFAWRTISCFDLGQHYEPSSARQFGSRVTLRGLAHLFACPVLEELTLPLIVQSKVGIDPLQLQGPSILPLKSLNIGYSPIGPHFLGEVAKFLIEHFPKLQDIRTHIETHESPEDSRIATEMRRRWNWLSRVI